MQYFGIEVSFKTQCLPSLVDLERDIQCGKYKNSETFEDFILEFKVGPFNHTAKYGVKL